MLDSLKLVFFPRWVVEVKMGPLMKPVKNMIEKVSCEYRATRHEYDMRFKSPNIFSRSFDILWII